MQLQPGNLGCQLPPPAHLRKFNCRRPELSPTLSSLPQLKQSSQNPCCPYLSAFTNHVPAKRLRVVPSSTSRRSSSNPPYRMQTVPEEERLVQHSICLSESSRSQFQGLYSTPPPPHLSSFPFLHWTSLPLSQQSSHQLTRECHNPSREIFRIKTLPPFPQRTSTSSQMVRFVMASRATVPTWLYSAKMTTSTSGILPWAPIEAPSKQRRQTSNKPSNRYPQFHHGAQLSSSATTNHCYQPSATPSQLTRLSYRIGLQWQYLPCQCQY